MKESLAQAIAETITFIAPPQTYATTAGRLLPEPGTIFSRRSNKNV